MSMMLERLSKLDSQLLKIGSGLSRVPQRAVGAPQDNGALCHPSKSPLGAAEAPLLKYVVQ
jgi:hypothetical protein